MSENNMLGSEGDNAFDKCFIIKVIFDNFIECFRELFFIVSPSFRDFGDSSAASINISLISKAFSIVQ